MPWSYKVMDDNTNSTHWKGYCVDFVAMLAEKMEFDYELIEPKKGTFGERNSNGDFDGVVGDLQRGVRNLKLYNSPYNKIPSINC